MLTFQDLHLHVQTHREMPLKILFIYSGNKEIYCIFKTNCMSSVLLSTEFCLFHNFMFLFPNNTFFVNHVLKFKYQAGGGKVKYMGDIRVNTVA